MPPRDLPENQLWRTPEQVQAYDNGVEQAEFDAEDVDAFNIPNAEPVQLQAMEELDFDDLGEEFIVNDGNQLQLPPPPPLARVGPVLTDAQIDELLDDFFQGWDWQNPQMGPPPPGPN